MKTFNILVVTFSFCFASTATATNYNDYEEVSRLITKLSTPEEDRVFIETAMDIYTNHETIIKTLLEQETIALKKEFTGKRLASAFYAYYKVNLQTHHYFDFTPKSTYYWSDDKKIPAPDPVAFFDAWKRVEKKVMLVAKSTGWQYYRLRFTGPSADEGTKSYELSQKLGKLLKQSESALEIKNTLLQIFLLHWIREHGSKQRETFYKQSLHQEPLAFFPANFKELLQRKIIADQADQIDKPIDALIIEQINEVFLKDTKFSQQEAEKSTAVVAPRIWTRDELLKLNQDHSDYLKKYEEQQEITTTTFTTLLKKQTGACHLDSGEVVPLQEDFVAAAKAHRELTKKEDRHQLEGLAIGRRVQELEDSFLRLRDAYNRQMNLLSYCRAKDLSAEPFPYENKENRASIDKAFVHVLGDIFAQNTGLEGLNKAESYYMRKWRKSAFENISGILQLQENTYIKNLDQANPCHDIRALQERGLCQFSHPSPDPDASKLKARVKKSSIAAKLYLPIYYKESTEFSKIFTTNIAALAKQEDYVYIPITWTGHAIIIEYILQNATEKTFKVRVYNSGYGVSSYHYNLRTGTLMRNFPYAEKENVSLDSIVDPLAIKVFWEIVTASGDLTGYSDPEDIYTRYLDYALDGNQTTRDLKFSDFVDPQKGGTCAYFVHGYRDQVRQTKEEWVLEQFLLGLKSFKTYFSSPNSQRIISGWDTPAPILSQKAVAAFSAAAARSYQRHELDLGSMRAFAELIRKTYHPLLKDQKTALNEVPQIKAALLSDTIKRLDLTDKAPSTGAQELGDRAAVELNNLIARDWDPADKRAINTKITELQTKFLALKNSKTWIFTDALQIEVGEWFSDQIETLVLKLPLDAAKKTKTAQLSWLAFHYFKNLKQLRSFIHERTTSSEIEPHSVLVLIKLLALMQIALPTEDINLYQALFDTFILPQHPMFFELSSDWKEELARLRTFWQDKKTPEDLRVRDFFGFDRLPTGTRAERLLFKSLDAKKKYIAQIKKELRHWSFHYSEIETTKLQQYWKDIRWLQTHLSKDFIVTTTDAVKLFSKKRLTTSSEINIPEWFFDAYTVSALSNFLFTGNIERLELDGDTIAPPKLSMRDNLYLGAPLPLPRDYSSTKLYGFSGGPSELYLPGSRIVDGRYQAGHLRGIFLAEKNPYAKPLVLKKYDSDEEGKASISKHTSSGDSLKTAPLKEGSKSEEKRDQAPGFELFRELTHITAKKDLQVRATLDFFRKYPYLLVQPQYMYEFRTLLFESNLLREEFERSPTFAQELHDFLVTQIKEKTSQQRFMLVLYLLEIYVQAHEVDPLNTPFADRRDRLSTLQKKTSIKADTFLLGFLSLLKMRSYEIEKSSFWEEQENITVYLKDLLFATRSSKAIEKKLPVRLRHSWRIATRIYTEFLFSQSDLIITILNEAVRGSLLVGDGDWTRQLLTSRYQKGTTTVDLMTGVITIEGQALSGLSLEVLENDVFKKRFHPSTVEGVVQFQVPVPGENKWSMFNDLPENAVFQVFLDQDKRCVMVSKDKKGNLQFYKKWTEQWYYLQSPAGENGKWILYPQYDEWVSVGKTPFGKDFQTSAAPIYENRRDLEGEQRELLIFDPDTTFLRYVGRGKNVSGKWQGWVKQVTLDSDIYKLSDIELAYGKGNEKNRLEEFEDPKFIYYWWKRPAAAGEAAAELVEVELPRFRIKLRKGTDDELVFPDLGDFVLSNELVPGLELVPFGLVFKKDKHKIVLFPDFAFTRYEIDREMSDLHYRNIMKPITGTATKFVLEREDRSFSRHTFLQYSVVEGQLQANNLHERLYLAQVYLWLSKYQQALDLIRSSHSRLQAFTEKEVTQVLRIIYDDDRDHSMKAHAVHLAALALYLQNASDFFYTTKKKEIKAPPNIRPYDRYQKLLENPDFLREDWLTRKEEEMILESKVVGLFEQARLAEIRKGVLAIHKATPPEHKAIEEIKIDQENLLRAMFQSIKGKESSSYSSISVEKNKVLRCEQLQRGKDAFLAFYKGIHHYRTQEGSLVHIDPIINLIIDKDLVQKAEEPTQSYEGRKLAIILKFLTLCKLSNDKNTKILATFFKNHLSGEYERFTFTTEQLKTAFGIEAGSGLTMPTGQLGGFDLSTTDAIAREPAIIPPRRVAVQGVPQQNLDWEEIDKREKTAVRLRSELNLKIPNNIRPEQLLLEPIFSKEEAERMFVKIPATATLPVTLKDYLDGIQSYLPHLDKSQALKTSLDNTKKDVRTKATKILREPGYKFRDEEGENTTSILDSISLDFTAKVDSASREIEGIRTGLQRTLRAVTAEDPEDRILQDIYQSAGTLTNLKIKDIEHIIANWHHEDTLYLRPEIIRMFRERNILQQTLRLMIFKVYRAHLKYILTKIAEMKDNPTSETIKEFIATVSQRRSYVIKEKPEYLAFEASRGVLIREDQIETLKQLAPQTAGEETSLGLLKEQIMGSGKTFLVIPLAALENTKGDKISMVVLPRSLLPSVVQDLARTMTEGFSRKVQVIFAAAAQRGDHKQLSVDDLEHIYRSLAKAQEEGHVLVASNEGIQSFFLSFIRVLNEGDDEIAKQGRRLRQYQKIFTLLKNHGHLIVDEVDMIFDVLKAHQVGFGAPQPLNRDLVETSIALYNTMLTQESYYNLVNSAFKTREGAPAFTKAYYFETLKPQLINLILQEGFFSDQRTQDLWMGFVREKELPLRTYLLNSDESAEENTTFFDSLAADTAAAIKLKTITAVLFEQLNFGLPLTLGRFLKIHYGAMPSDISFGQSRKPYHIAIPYDNGAPKIESRFGSEIEAINYTLQMHLEEQKLVPLVQSQLEDFRARLEKARTAQEVAEIRSRYEKLINNSVLESPSMEHTAADIKLIAINIATNPPALFDLLREQAISQILFFPGRIHTNTQLYGQLFKGVQGVSGTLWNYHTFPKVYDPTRVDISDTEARTLLLLAQKADDQEVKPQEVKPINITSQSSVAERVEALLSIGCGACSVIDSGLFRGVENKIVAEEILKQTNGGGSSPQGIIFYDLANQIQVLNRSGETTPIQQNKIPKEQLLAYWDIQHSVGSDLKLGAQAKAVFFVKSHMIMRDLLQAVWRLRGLDKGQGVKIAISQNEKKAMEQVLQKTIGWTGKINNLKNLFLYLKVKEITRLTSLLNFRGFQQMLKGVNTDEAIKQLTNLQYNRLQLAEGIKDVRELFVEETKGGLYQRLGKPRPPRPKEEVMQEEVIKVWSQYNKLYRMYDEWSEQDKREKVQELTSNQPIDHIYKKLVKIKEDLATHIKQFIQAQGNYGTEVEIDTEQEQEQELEQIQIFADDLERDFVPIPRALWQAEQIFQATCYPSTLNKAQLEGTAGFTYRKDQYEDSESTVDLNVPCPVVALNLALDIREKKTPKFSDNFLTSLNYTPVFKNEEGNHTVFDFFSPRQKVNTYHLVVENGGNIQVVLLDPEETSDLRRWIGKKAAKAAEAAADSETKLTLMHTTNGVLAHTYLSDDGLEALITNEKYIELRAQIKFFNGEIEYTDDEFSALQVWKTANKGLDFQEFFETQILAYRDETIILFEDSKLFEELKLTEEDVEDDE